MKTMYLHHEADLFSSGNQLLWQLLLLIQPLCLLTGCGNGLNLAEVSGVITLDGNPLPSVIVGFTPKEGGRGSGNMTNEKGEYRLVFNRDAYGALVGEHKVTVLFHRAPEAILEKKEKKKLVTEFEATVKPGKNDLDFELIPDGLMGTPDTL